MYKRIISLVLVTVVDSQIAGCVLAPLGSERARVSSTVAAPVSIGGHRGVVAISSSIAPASEPRHILFTENSRPVCRFDEGYEPVRTQYGQVSFCIRQVRLRDGRIITYSMDPYR